MTSGRGGPEDSVRPAQVSRPLTNGGFAAGMSPCHHSPAGLLCGAGAGRAPSLAGGRARGAGRMFGAGGVFWGQRQQVSIPSLLAKCLKNKGRGKTKFSKISEFAFFKGRADGSGGTTPATNCPHAPARLCDSPMSVGWEVQGEKQTPTQGQTLARLEGKTAMVALPFTGTPRKSHSVGCRQGLPETRVLQNRSSLCPWPSFFPTALKRLVI